jgi:hypothetical protein
MKTKTRESGSITAKGKEKSPPKYHSHEKTESTKTFFFTEFCQFSTVCDCHRNTRNV